MFAAQGTTDLSKDGRLVEDYDEEEEEEHGKKNKHGKRCII